MEDVRGQRRLSPVPGDERDDPGTTRPRDNLQGAQLLLNVNAISDNADIVMEETQNSVPSHPAWRPPHTSSPLPFAFPFIGTPAAASSSTPSGATVLSDPQAFATEPPPFFSSAPLAPTAGPLPTSSSGRSKSGADFVVLVSNKNSRSFTPQDPTLKQRKLSSPPAPGADEEDDVEMMHPFDSALDAVYAFPKPTTVASHRLQTSFLSPDGSSTVILPGIKSDNEEGDDESVATATSSATTKKKLKQPPAKTKLGLEKRVIGNKKGNGQGGELVREQRLPWPERKDGRQRKDLDEDYNPGELTAKAKKKDRIRPRAIDRRRSATARDDSTVSQESSDDTPLAAMAIASPFNPPAPDNFADAGTSSMTVNGVAYMLQDTTCLSRRVDRYRRCYQCISRVSGHGCSFRNLRSIPVDPFSCAAPLFLSSPEPAEAPLFPVEFNEPLTERHREIIKSAAATHLLSTMEKELEHATRDGGVRVKMEPAVRSTCDTCLHVILSGSWLCTNCGREQCFACQQSLVELTEHEKTHPHDLSIKGGGYTEEENRWRRCSGGKVGVGHLFHSHAPDTFIPLTRFDVKEVSGIVHDMREWIRTHPAPRSVPIAQERIEAFYAERNERHMSGEEESLAYMTIPAAELAPLIPLPTVTEGFPSPSRVVSLELSPVAPAATPAPTTIDDVVAAQSAAEDSATALFRELWKRGEPMVVDINDGDHYRLDWTPAYFIDKFGDTPCSIASNRSQKQVSATVGAFFATFGKTRDVVETHKIKDWPSTTDFKLAFPELFADFMRALPIGCVTRRDGVLNIAAHTPSNANPPDLGPKGYFSQISDDQPGGQGSTKLHTVNLMLWSGDDEDGRPGTAAWDLFRAEDSELVRDFLYEVLAERLGKGMTAVKLRLIQDDPIHGQNVYLDSALRKRLLEEKGVKPFRIWQSPGQVVFIPAGCAHQVCNFADCIKIASDFVSIENVSRCWKVTEEFRTQTKERALWRSDVLQLKSQLLWAWKSCSRFDTPL